MEWNRTVNNLRGEFNFVNFSQAFAFMTEVAMEAEKMNHHPEWSNIWNKVLIVLSTHDAGNIVTEKDLELAHRIDKIYDRYQH